MIDIAERVWKLDQDWVYPSSTVISNCQQLLKELYLNTNVLNNPIIGNGPTGEIVVEWRYKTKSLLIEFHNNETFAIKAWGPNTSTEMEDVLIKNSEDIFPLLKQLYNK